MQSIEAENRLHLRLGGFRDGCCIFKRRPQIESCYIMSQLISFAAKSKDISE